MQDWIPNFICLRLIICNIGSFFMGKRLHLLFKIIINFFFIIIKFFESFLMLYIEFFQHFIYICLACSLYSSSFSKKLGIFKIGTNFGKFNGTPQRAIIIAVSTVSYHFLFNILSKLFEFIIYSGTYQKLYIYFKQNILCFPMLFLLKNK